LPFPLSSSYIIAQTQRISARYDEKQGLHKDFSEIPGLQKAGYRHRDSGVASPRFLHINTEKNLCLYLLFISYPLCLSFIILKVVDAVMGLRVTHRDERTGLDLTQHHERGYTLMD